MNKALIKLMMKLEAHTLALQCFWKNTHVNSTGSLVKSFSAVGPTSTRIKRIPFDEVVSYLREQNVVWRSDPGVPAAHPCAHHLSPWLACSKGPCT